MDVIATDEFAAWFEKLPEESACAVTKAIELLESVGTDAPHVRVLEMPFGMQVRTRAPRTTPFAIPASLRELSAEGRAERVLFAVEDDGARVVLLYGYDVSRERARSPVGVPLVAHMLVAARVYGIYRKEVA